LAQYFFRGKLKYEKFRTRTTDDDRHPMMTTAQMTLGDM